MQTRTYTEKSNARRAARAAGVDPGLVIETEDGFTFPINGNDIDPVASAELRKEDHAEDEFAPITFNGPAIIDAARESGSLDTAPETDNEDIPAFCKITPEDRGAEWSRNPPKVTAKSISREIDAMAKAKTSKASKKDKPSGADKNATALAMLKNGATVEALCKATDWLPHTLRARISRMNKPKSKGGEGLKIERDRVDGITSYRIAP